MTLVTQVAAVHVWLALLADVTGYYRVYQLSLLGFCLEHRHRSRRRRPLEWRLSYYGLMCIGDCL